MQVLSENTMVWKLPLAVQLFRFGHGIFFILPFSFHMFPCQLFVFQIWEFSMWTMQSMYFNMLRAISLQLNTKLFKRGVFLLNSFFNFEPHLLGPVFILKLTSDLRSLTGTEQFICWSLPVTWKLHLLLFLPFSLTWNPFMACTFKMPRADRKSTHSTVNVHKVWRKSLQASACQIC